MANPFEDESDAIGQYSNPFADAAVTKALTDTSGEDDFNYSYNPSSSAAPVANDEKPWKRQSQAPSQSEAEIMAIARQKQEMMEREEELERQRQALASAQFSTAAAQPPPSYDQPTNAVTGVKINNWPFFYPFMYHSIKDEIPKPDQLIVRSLYYSWFLNVICYIANMIGCLCILISGYSGKDFGYSIMYVVFCIPLSFFLHYRPAYNAFMKDSSFYYYIFFFNGAAHIIWMAYIIIGIQDSGSAGFINVIFMFNYNNGSSKGEAIVLLIALLLWFVNLGTFCYLYVRVRNQYRTKGHTFAEARNQAFTSTASNPAVQQAAAGAFTSAASNPAVQQAAAGAATSYVSSRINPYQRQVDDDV